MPKKKIKSEGQNCLKQPAISRQRRRNRQDTAFTVIDGRRIHLGLYGTPEAEKEYRCVVAEEYRYRLFNTFSNGACLSNLSQHPSSTN